MLDTILMWIKGTAKRCKHSIILLLQIITIKFKDDFKPQWTVHTTPLHQDQLMHTTPGLISFVVWVWIWSCEMYSFYINTNWSSPRSERMITEHPTSFSSQLWFYSITYGSRSISLCFYFHSKHTPHDFKPCDVILETSRNSYCVCKSLKSLKVGLIS